MKATLAIIATVGWVLLGALALVIMKKDPIHAPTTNIVMHIVSALYGVAIAKIHE